MLKYLVIVMIGHLRFPEVRIATTCIVLLFLLPSVFGVLPFVKKWLKVSVTECGEPLNLVLVLVMVLSVPSMPVVTVPFLGLCRVRCIN